VALVAVVAMVTLLVTRAYATAPRRTLRVCADPNTLPFSNDKGEGFENTLAELVARELHADLRFGVPYAKRVRR
jgi:mxaJ protein